MAQAAQFKNEQKLHSLEWWPQDFGVITEKVLLGAATDCLPQMYVILSKVILVSLGQKKLFYTETYFWTTKANTAYPDFRMSGKRPFNQKPQT